MPAESLGGLSADFWGQIQAALSQYSEIQCAVLFGSRAMGTQRSNSDIDLCVDARELPFATFLRLASELDELVLPYRLDLILRHHIENPDLLQHIDRVGKVVYESGGVL